MFKVLIFVCWAWLLCFALAQITTNAVWAPVLVIVGCTLYAVAWSRGYDAARNARIELDMNREIREALARHARDVNEKAPWN